MKVRTITQQTLHYFARKHTAIPTAPLNDPAAWRPDTLGPFAEIFGPADIAEIEAGLAVARSSGKALYELDAADLPLPTLLPRLEGWREQLAHGRGFVLLRGLPVARWSETDCERFFWVLGRRLGLPGAQNPAGDLLGHVRDEGFDHHQEVRGYRTRAHIDFHCDAADVVGLFCLQPAQSGGTSRIASSVSVFNALVQERPDLAAALFAPFSLDTKGEGGLRHYAVPPCRYSQGKLRTFYHADYFRSVARHADAPALRGEQLEALHRYDELAASLSLSMELRAGDIQLLNNHTQIHARDGYMDGPGKRHLLRLWLSLERGGGGSWPAWLRLVTRLGWQRWVQRRTP